MMNDRKRQRNSSVDDNPAKKTQHILADTIVSVHRNKKLVSCIK